MDTRHKETRSKKQGESTDSELTEKSPNSLKRRFSQNRFFKQLSKRPVSITFVCLALIIVVCLANAAGNAANNHNSTSTVQQFNVGDYVVYKMTITANNQQTIGYQTVKIDSLNGSKVDVGIGYLDLPDYTPYFKTCAFNITDGIWSSPSLFGAEYSNGGIVDQKVLNTPYGEKRMDDYRTNNNGAQVDGYYPIGSGVPFKKTVIWADGTMTEFELYETNVEWLQNI